MVRRRRQGFGMMGLRALFWLVLRNELCVTAVVTAAAAAPNGSACVSRAYVKRDRYCLCAHELTIVFPGLLHSFVLSLLSV